MCAFSAKIMFEHRDFEEEFKKALANHEGPGRNCLMKNNEGIKSRVTVPLKIKFMGEIVGAKFKESYSIAGAATKSTGSSILSKFLRVLLPVHTTQCFRFALSLNLHMLMIRAASSLAML
jgi:hypothetical protein